MLGSPWSLRAWGSWRGRGLWLMMLAKGLQGLWDMNGTRAGLSYSRSCWISCCWILEGRREALEPEGEVFGLAPHPDPFPCNTQPEKHVAQGSVLAWDHSPSTPRWCSPVASTGLQPPLATARPPQLAWTPQGAGEGVPGAPSHPLPST